MVQRNRLCSSGNAGYAPVWHLLPSEGLHRVPALDSALLREACSRYKQLRAACQRQSLTQLACLAATQCPRSKITLEYPGKVGQYAANVI